MGSVLSTYRQCSGTTNLPHTLKLKMFCEGFNAIGMDGIQRTADGRIRDLFCLSATQIQIPIIQHFA